MPDPKWGQATHFNPYKKHQEGGDPEDFDILPAN